MTKIQETPFLFQNKYKLENFSSPSRAEKYTQQQPADRVDRERCWVERIRTEILEISMDESSLTSTMKIHPQTSPYKTEEKHFVRLLCSNKKAVNSPSALMEPCDNGSNRHDSICQQNNNVEGRDRLKKPLELPIFPEFAQNAPIGTLGPSRNQQKIAIRASRDKIVDSTSPGSQKNSDIPPRPKEINAQPKRLASDRTRQASVSISDDVSPTDISLLNKCSTEVAYLIAGVWPRHLLRSFLKAAFPQISEPSFRTKKNQVCFKAGRLSGNKTPDFCR